MHKLSSFKRGDTLIEVMLSVAIFGMVTVGSIQLMNRGVATAQGNLETSMARNEIDAQAEALRFIHKAYTTNRSNPTNQYSVLWRAITQRAVKFDHASLVNFFNNYNGASCTNDSGNYTEGIITSNSFIINPRFLNSHNMPTSMTAYTSDPIGTKILSFYGDGTGNLSPAKTYPRIIYSSDESAGTPLADSNNAAANSDTVRRDFDGAEGIWVTAVRSDAESSGNPNYYDFYIRTCWSNISGNGSTTISSIVRLYNPDIAPAAEIAGGGGGSPVTPVDPSGGGGYDPSPDPTPTPDPATPTPSEPEPEPKNPEICFGESGSETCYPDTGVYLSFIFQFEEVFGYLPETYLQASASSYGVAINSPYGLNCFYFSDISSYAVINSAVDAAQYPCRKTTPHYSRPGSLNTGYYHAETFAIHYRLTDDLFPTTCMYSGVTPSGERYCTYHSTPISSFIFDADAEHNSFVMYEAKHFNDPTYTAIIAGHAPRAKFYFPREVSHCAFFSTQMPKAGNNCRTFDSIYLYRTPTLASTGTPGFEYTYSRWAYNPSIMTPSADNKTKNMKIGTNPPLEAILQRQECFGSDCPSKRKKINVTTRPLFTYYASGKDPGIDYNPSGFTTSF